LPRGANFHEADGDILAQNHRIITLRVRGFWERRKGKREEKRERGSSTNPQALSILSIKLEQKPNQKRTSSRLGPNPVSVIVLIRVSILTLIHVF